MNKNTRIIVNILEKVKEFTLGISTDVGWSRFESKEEVIKEINNHIQRLRNNDFSKIEELIFLFLPTSDLQEISISSGWGKEFLVIAEKFDNAIKDLIRRIK
ncbi:hypothetical protein LCGC14_1437480 [marine sediment metagenome]|uniref:Uncharacterized protein n=1 Tax=marine sediment metagenome TaxID=412755 RepID=A0A0F9MNN4_9ZZZZ